MVAQRYIFDKLLASPADFRRGAPKVFGLD